MMNLKCTTREIVLKILRLRLLQLEFMNNLSNLQAAKKQKTSKSDLENEVNVNVENLV